MLTDKKNIFIVGIKGAAMANIAVILQKMGKQVTGSDLEEEFITDTVLHENDIRIFSGFNPADISADTDLVLYSGAHQGKLNPQVIESQKKNILVMGQSEFLGHLVSLFQTSIAVSGCHGKTTTSSLLAHMLIQLQSKPSYLVGTSSFGKYQGGDFQSLSYFIIEADEYGVNPPSDITPKFHHLKTTWALCTNIDFDHPDIYRDIEHTKEEFMHFFKGKKLVLCRDDENLHSLLPKLALENTHTYGFDTSSDLVISDDIYNETSSSFTLHLKKPNGVQEHLGRFIMPLAGKKNILNATAAIFQLILLGFNSNDIQKALSSFAGAKRRFEFVADTPLFRLYDDYGHHPHEIEATIDAARKRFPNQRIIVIFQPHTYSRTFDFKKQFADSLLKADTALILPIFASARERQENYPVSSKDIELAASDPKVKSFINSKELLSYLQTIVREKDIIFTLGAGDVYKLKDDIIELGKSYGNLKKN